MGLDSILNIAASSMSAESIRLNTNASNIANAGTVGGDPSKTYHARHPVFSEVKQQIDGLTKNDQPIGGVRVVNIIESEQPLSWRIDPDNPLANSEGKVFMTDVNPIEEMADMISASKQYQASVEMMNTTKSLLLQTIKAINNY